MHHDALNYVSSPNIIPSFFFNSFVCIVKKTYYICLSYETNRKIKQLRVIQLISLLTSVNDLICKVIDLECMNMHLWCVNRCSYSFSFASEHADPYLEIAQSNAHASGSEPAYMFLNATRLQFLHISLFAGPFDSGIPPHTWDGLYFIF